MYPYILLNIVGGIFVISSYTAYLPRLSTKQLWAGLSTSERIYTIISLLVAIIAFIMAFILIVRHEEEHPNSIKRSLFLGVILFYLGAMLWPPMLYHNHKSFVLVALLLTTIGAFFMFLYSPTLYTKLLMLIVLLHCFIIDNVMWYSSYINQ